jgi:6-phosphofructokinase 1
MEQARDFMIRRLGDCTVPSPMSGVFFTRDEEHVLLHSDIATIRRYLDAGIEPPKFEAAGPREKIFFDPSKLACGIVTCGGLCPGLNDVIRSVVLSLHHHYGVRTIYGFPYGYEGLAPKFGHQPIMLTPEVVAHISQMGGTPEPFASTVSRHQRR